MNDEKRVRCKQHTWILGERLGGGAYGDVYAARSESSGQLAAAKLVDKDPGAERELLFNDDLTGVRNIVPVIDDGETEEQWALVMRRAETSLDRHIEAQGGSFSPALSTSILIDVATTLVDLDVKDPAVVHRDVKPHNVLLLDGRWCLADFGISRYADATTGPHTRKSKWSSWYAAPERWTGERATSATDVYSLGIIGYELMVGWRPFISDNVPELQRLHTKVLPTFPETAPTPLVELVEECLYKAPGARPSAENLLRRLESIMNRVG